ncbi:MAG: 4Fe-4S binding protein [Firmicutes bacterium]|nr:4Fe-4S binding protein [Bacillota bacterium]
MKHPGKIAPEVFKNIVKPAATLKYPFVKPDIPATYRGKIVFDAKSCIGCKLCMRDCPSKAIAIEKVGEEKVFRAHFDLDRCIYCAQCVDSCPRNSLATTTQFELANYSREKLKEIQG